MSRSCSLQRPSPGPRGGHEPLMAGRTSVSGTSRGAWAAHAASNVRLRDLAGGMSRSWVDHLRPEFGQDEACTLIGVDTTRLPRSDSPPDLCIVHEAREVEGLEERHLVPSRAGGGVDGCLDI